MPFAYVRKLTIDHTLIGAADQSNVAVLYTPLHSDLVAGGPMSATQTNLPVQWGKQILVNDYLQIGTEKLLVTAVSGTSLTVTRGALGTTATTHNPADEIRNLYLANPANGGNVQSAQGYDIVFALDPNGATTIPFERVGYHPTGEVEFWLRLPAVSASADTRVYVLYGDGTVTADQQQRTSVWDAAFMGVYHFGDGTTLDLSDSTANGNNGTNHGASAVLGDAHQSSPIYGAVGFNVPLGSPFTTQYVDFGNPPGLQLTNALTIEFWTRLTNANGSLQRILSKAAGNTGYEFLINSDTVETQIGSGSMNTIMTPDNATFVSYCALTYDGATMKYYGSNGHYLPGDLQLEATKSIVNGLGNTAASLTLGRDSSGTASTEYGGWIEELRISNVVRDLNYFTLNFANQHMGPRFWSMAPAQSTLGPVVYVIT
jgi:hypothetical protein